MEISNIFKEKGRSKRKKNENEYPEYDFLFYLLSPREEFYK